MIVTKTEVYPWANGEPPTDGDWICVRKEWRKLNGDPFPPYVEARAEEYGCDTGCVGYVAYLVDADGRETRLSDFDFGGEESISVAEREAVARGVPYVIRKSLGW